MDQQPFTNEMLKSTEPEKPTKKNPFGKGELWDIVKFTFIALLIVIPVRIFIAQPFVVSGESMVPTFEHGDYLIIDEISYRLNEPQRGDVVVFRYPFQPDRFFIKRIIGLPGETVRVRDNMVRIINEQNPEGLFLDESFLLGIDTEGSSTESLGENEYFVMGDNRRASSDSRAWGPLPEEFIVGRAWVRLFPFKSIDFLPGGHDLTFRSES